ncbi:serine endopeptidase [Geopseudomonas aromaticivorans]
MNQTQRRSEKWFRIALWLIAIIFAGFLINLGNGLIKDLPLVEKTYTQNDFIDRTGADLANREIADQQTATAAIEDALEQKMLALETARQNTRTGRDSLNAWLASRQVTQNAGGDDDLMKRTEALEHLQLAERQALAQVEAERKRLVDTQQAASRTQARLSALQEATQVELAKAQRKQELRVFLYRLALTLPLLAVAGWLFARKRKSSWWPFVWGYIFFALFVFFIELVPYLPSLYGGYVRNIVGVIVTVLVGRQAILALNRYLERQRQAEARPETERRKEIAYDTSLLRLSKNVCPGCERPLNLSSDQLVYCPHCGLGIFENCSGCQTRKSAFSRFCFACGTASTSAAQATPPAAPAPAPVQPS